MTRWLGHCIVGLSITQDTHSRRFPPATARFTIYSELLHDKQLWLALITILATPLWSEAFENPLHPSEAMIVEQIIAVEGHTVEVAEMPGWAKGGVINLLKEFGIETGNLKSWGVRDKTKNGISFSCIYDANCRVLALTGNGPWLRDESLRALKGMPELRIIASITTGS